MSEKLSNLITQRETINYIDLSDDKIKNELIKKYVDELGYFLYPSELFCNVLKNARDNENLNETLETIFKNIENSSIGSQSEKFFSKMFSDLELSSIELGDTKEKRNKTLFNLLNSISKINIENNDAFSSDLLGDIYEFLLFSYDSCRKIR